MNYAETWEYLKGLDQEHLLKYYELLNEAERASLLQQIESIDFSLIRLLDAGCDPDVKRGEFAPLSALTVDEIRKNETHFREIGLDALRKQKTAAVLLAGGQGTRLGFDKPKGMFNVGKTHDLFIFECLINNMLDVVKESGAFIPLYIMTSVINHEDTVGFFKEKNYFGYDPSFVKFFIQDMAPCVGFDGKVLLEAPGKVAMSPNGNGGWFTSLKKAGLLDDMKARGIGTLYLVTDHTGFYERYGWEFLCMAQGDGETHLSRLYVHR